MLVTIFVGRGVSHGQCNGSIWPLFSWFSRPEPLLFTQVAPQLSSHGWVESVPDLHFHLQCGTATRMCLLLSPETNLSSWRWIWLLKPQLSVQSTQASPSYAVSSPLGPFMDITEVVSMDIAIFLAMMLHSLVNRHLCIKLHSIIFHKAKLHYILNILASSGRNST
jgi:hypothetical protein